MPTKPLISKQVESSLNAAIASEFYASHLYRHLANHLQRLGYFGAQKFFLGEAADELTHQQKLADFMNDMGAVAQTPAIEAMTEAVGSLADALESAYDTEAQLLKDYVAWHRSADPVTQQFLLQFIEIQRRSVGEFGDWISRLDRCGDDKAALLMLDKELGE